MEDQKMLNRICITTQKGCRGMSNARINGAFKNVFSVDPVMIRTEGKKIIIHTSLDLSDKKVRKFAGKLGDFTNFKGKDDSYEFYL